MKYSTLTFICTLFLASFTFAQSSETNIIPKPQSITPGNGNFKLNRETKIVAKSDSSLRTANILNDVLERRFGYRLKVSKKDIAINAIVIVVLWTKNPESYMLRIQPDVIQLYGDERGRFYGLQSFFQLMPIVNNSVDIPAVLITDTPRFKYRGMHLDVARHFMPVSFVKKYIDLMSQYKFNYFHWHLTEDQGWRIEIKKYPRLTEIGSKRKETVKERNLTPYIGDGIPVEGFYTQEEIKDVVAYAKARYITVIPEIELPGHASAALAAYPEFGCKENYDYQVKTTWGIFKEVFCPTEKTFGFLEDVLTETIALFPDSPYIHIGGDEVLKDHWKESPFVQELKKRENLKDENEVQSYFVRRIEKFINSKGKKMIGWDEILEGGLAPNATVMSWRGMKGGIEAAKSKHDVIMTPTDFVYFDYGQGDPAYEPLNIGSYVTTEKVYSFDPVPPELTAEEGKYVIGGQANVWTEYIKTPSHVEYMVFPRMLALSEVLWSRPEDKNFTDFQKRLPAHFPRLDKQKVNYRIPEPIGLKNAVIPKGGAVGIEGIRSEIPGAKVLFTVDGTEPTENSGTIPARFIAKPGENEVLTLKTIVVLPNGRKSAVYAATFVSGKLLEPVKLADSKPGVKFEFLVPNENPGNKSAAELGETKSILLNQFAPRYDLKKPFVSTFDGYFNAPSDGVYEFQADSTWDATVTLGSDKIIDDTGTKDRSVKSAIVPLKAGLHKISLRYNHRGGDSAFRFRWGIKGQGLRQIYGGELFH